MTLEDDELNPEDKLDKLNPPEDPELFYDLSALSPEELADELVKIAGSLLSPGSTSKTLSANKSVIVNISRRKRRRKRKSPLGNA